MSSGSYIQVYVRCPFYLGDDGKGRILCEGITGEDTIRLQFRQREDWLKQMRAYCCAGYGGCAVCRMLTDSKYPPEYWQTP